MSGEVIQVALARCRSLPEPDPDAAPLADALTARGIATRWLSWDDPSAQFAAAELVVVRSTWNYHHHHEAFLAWCERMGARLCNPPGVVRWNSHKSYLLDLAARGIAVVPTVLARRHELPSAERAAWVAAQAEARGWHDVVMKPAVSAASFGTFRVTHSSLQKGALPAPLLALFDERDVLVQPYLDSVEGYGERSLVVIDGQLTHAIRKSPRFGGQIEAVSPAVPIADDERALAEQLLAGLPAELLYARIDLARTADGLPCVMECELIEPSLFLSQWAPAQGALVEAIARRLAGGRARVAVGRGPG